MAKIGCLKPFRGSWNGMKDVVLEDGEIAFITEGSKIIYFGNGTDKVENLTPFADIGGVDISSIGGGSITSAISTLNNNISANVIGNLTTITTDLFTFPKDGYIYLNAEISGAKCIVNLADANGTGIQSEVAMGGNCHFVYVKKGMKCALSTGSQGSYDAFYIPLS